MLSHRFALPVALVVLVSSLFFALVSSSAAAPNAVPQNWMSRGNKLKAGEFLGSTNAQPLIFKTNKVEAMRIDASGNVGIGTTAPTSKLTVTGLVQSTSGGFKFPDGTTQTTAVTGGPNGWGLGGNAGTNSSTNFLGTTDNNSLVFKTNATERMRISESGNVGIGTANPTDTLHITGVTRMTTGGSGGDILFAAPNGETGMTIKGTNRADVRYDGSSLKLVAGSGVTPPSSTNGIDILNDGRVTMGTTSSYANATLTVKAKDSNFASNIFSLVDLDGNPAFGVTGFGAVKMYGTSGIGAQHLCFAAPDFLQCSSAAEYAPSRDAGLGYPETADLVTIAGATNISHGDIYASYAVQKSTTPCDSNLLGFISDPKLGADGTKLDDHYLPLALSGTLPAKVTIENGIIHRGDPLTSSSKPGYAMKATDACKIIGYALEDATTDGIIQVFAHLSENTAPQVAELRSKVDALTQENLALKQELASINARLSALEQASPVSQNTTGASASQP